MQYVFTCLGGPSRGLAPGCVPGGGAASGQILEIRIPKAAGRVGPKGKGTHQVGFVVYQRSTNQDTHLAGFIHHSSKHHFDGHEPRGHIRAPFIHQLQRVIGSKSQKCPKDLDPTSDVQSHGQNPPEFQKNMSGQQAGGGCSGGELHGGMFRIRGVHIPKGWLWWNLMLRHIAQVTWAR